MHIADSDGRIADGELVKKLDRGYAALRGWLEATALTLSRIYTCDWEGGHIDHDALHLIALAIANDARCPLYCFSLYNAYHRPKKLFRTFELVPASEPIEVHPLSLGDALAIALAPLAYPSQRRTWLALGPGLVARLLIRRSERVRIAGVRRVCALPHSGRPLYETLFGFQAECFMQISQEFRHRLLATASPTQADT